MHRFVPFSLNIKGYAVEFCRPQVMGILNVTPDSFYAASRRFDEESIAERAQELLSHGADMIDLGAYSSRPGADVVSSEEELRRLRLGISTIRERISKDIILSIDTFRADVARIAVEDYGADIVNDISGGDLDSEMYATVARLGVPYILMHMRGTPSTMQSLTNYSDITADVLSELAVKLSKLNDFGVNDVIVDPGFGFAKNVDQNYALMKHLEMFHVFDRPLLVGISRKSMIYKPLKCSPEEALCGTTVLNTIALIQGASILRVHDPKEASEAVKIVGLTYSPD